MQTPLRQKILIMKNVIIPRPGLLPCPTLREEISAAWERV